MVPADAHRRHRGCSGGKNMKTSGARWSRRGHHTDLWSRRRERSDGAGNEEQRPRNGERERTAADPHRSRGLARGRRRVGSGVCERIERRRHQRSGDGVNVYCVYFVFFYFIY